MQVEHMQRIVAACSSDCNGCWQCLAVSHWNGGPVAVPMRRTHAETLTAYSRNNAAAHQRRKG
jgi:hypothetical protein